MGKSPKLYEATVKPESSQNLIVSCAGVKFTKGVYLRVPTGLEGEARAQPNLSVREVKRAPAPKPKKESKAKADKPLNAKDSIKAVNALSTVAEVNAFGQAEADGAARKSVLEAAKKRLTALEAEAEGD